MPEETNEIKKWFDKKNSQEKRKEFYDANINKIMNPTENFDPEDWEPLGKNEESLLANRKRIKPPKEMPTFGIKPKEIREGQMIGMFESKQDLYLIFAHRCNDQQLEIDELRKEIEKLKKK